MVGTMKFYLRKSSGCSFYEPRCSIERIKRFRALNANLRSIGLSNYCLKRQSLVNECRNFIRKFNL